MPSLFRPPVDPNEKHRRELQRRLVRWLNAHNELLALMGRLPCKDAHANIAMLRLQDSSARDMIAVAEYHDMQLQRASHRPPGVSPSSS